MTPNVVAILQRALRQLEAERQGLDRQILAIRSVLGEAGAARQSAGRATPRRAKLTRPGMSAAARRAVSQRMKAYWAKRRAAKPKGTAKP